MFAPAYPRLSENSPSLTGNLCIVCFDPIRGQEIRAPCGHYYDPICVAELFHASARDQSLFPPRCCDKPVTLRSVRRHLTPGVVAILSERSREFGTLNRVYCANPLCSRFLGPQSKRRRPKATTCPAAGCKTRTCRGCRARITPGAVHSCQLHEPGKDILAASTDWGWKRCPGCAQMVERHSGCDHMTCTCRTHFCYTCGRRWKRCLCRHGR